MPLVELLVEATGHSVVQDLGRPGRSSIGIAGNGAADQAAARTANILVGNGDDAPLIETTGSDLEVVLRSDCLMAVTGAVAHVIVDGFQQPAWETLLVPSGARVAVPLAPGGYRTYLSVNGEIDAPRALGSVAPDPLLGFGTRLAVGAVVRVNTRCDGFPPGLSPALFRLGADRPRLGPVATAQVTAGPDLGRLAGGVSGLAGEFEVLPESSEVGLRLGSTRLELTTAEEILSRGVPVGAIEVLPTGGLAVLLRGRLVTAGYPVVAVATTDSIDRLGQVGPGHTVQFEMCDVPSAVAALRRQQESRSRLASRVENAFRASGLGQILDRRHGLSGGVRR